MTSDAEQKYYEWSLQNKQYSYDLTQKLTYFVISAELVFCGYILLNANELGVIGNSSWLFLVAGIAAFSGILWRTFYNQEFNNHAHGNEVSRTHHLLQSTFYFSYFFLSILFFCAVLYLGYSYLNTIESLNKKTNPNISSPINMEK